MNDQQQNKRKAIILVSAMDTLLSGIVLLSYFGLFPFDIATSWGIQRWIVGLFGGVWFFVSVAILVYQLTKTEITE